MTDETPKRPQRHGGNPFAGGVPAPVTPPKPVRPSSGSPRASNAALKKAAQQLGVTDEELSEVEQATLQRLSVTDAARQLGQRSYRDERTARDLHTTWRYQTLMRFGTNAGRRWLVFTLESELTGEETEIPAEVLEAVEHGLSTDRQRTPDARALYSTRDAGIAYRGLADQHQGR